MDPRDTDLTPPLAAEPPPAPESAQQRYRQRRYEAGCSFQTFDLPKAMLADLTHYAKAHGLRGRAAALVTIWRQHRQIFGGSNTKEENGKGLPPLAR